ncbi:hypothetical protein ACYSNW_10720 [Enterococcus sp. LJL99]
MDNNIIVEGILGKPETSTSSSEKETNPSSTNESIIFETTSKDLPKGNENVSNLLFFIGLGILFILLLLVFKRQDKEKTNQ